MNLTTVLDFAVELGLPCFPCHADKRPACPCGFKDAESDPKKIKALFRRCPGELIGVPTGEVSGIDVLDIDAPRHPEAAAWYAARRGRVPITRIHVTRSGGLHLLFQHSDRLRCWTGRPVPGVDGRADGGYICWWPAAGFPVPCEAPPAAWPEWLLAELTAQPPARPACGPRANPAWYDHGSRYGNAALRNAARQVATAPFGSRNSTLNREVFGIGRLIAAGVLGAQQAADTLAGAAIAAGLHPREVANTLRSAFGARGLL